MPQSGAILFLCNVRTKMYTALVRKVIEVWLLSITCGPS